MESRKASRFNRHRGRAGIASSAASAEPHSRFRRRGSSTAGKSVAGSGGDRTASKRFRPHSSISRSSAACAPRGFSGHTDAVRRDNERQERGMDYRPAYPVYPTCQPFIPPVMYTHYNLYGNRLSRAEIAELEARERYEDRYGRDFNRYSGRKSPTPAESREIFPKDYLLDREE